MKDSSLLKLSLVCSLIGLMLLLVLSEFIEPGAVSISEAKSAIGAHVYIEGSVVEATYKDEVTFFTVSDGLDEIDIVIFEKMDEVLSEGDLIGVTGEISLYKGEEEVIVDEITCLKCGN